MDYKPATVNIADIDIKDRFFRISTRDRANEMAVSLRAVGMIRPPILRSETNRYCIVSGFTRVAAWQALGNISIRVLILENTVSPLDAARLAVAEITAERDLNVIEQSRVYHLLRSCSPADEDFRSACKSLGLPANSDLTDKLEHIAALPVYLIDHMRAGRLSASAAIELVKLPARTGKLLADILVDLRAGVNKQKEILTHIFEITAREAISVDTLLKEKDIQNLLTRDGGDRTLTLAAFRSFLKRRRFPEISSAEAAFNAIVSELSLPAAMKVTPPKYFEGDQFTLSIRFSDRDDLETCYTRLGEMIHHPAIDRLIE
jgi:ParB family chromosome partitioning protein